MTTTIFRDFTFSAKHHMPEKTGSAAHPHWHTYTVRMWFEAIHCQDALAEWMAATFQKLNSADLNTLALVDTSDEALAATILTHGQTMKCFRVQVTNDGKRGAEVNL